MDLDYYNDDSTHPIICINCHSSNFYRNSETDILTCYECHTQSQSQSQREVADDEDFFNLVAKSSRVGYKSTVRSRSRRLEDHELDGSRPLPDVVECCEAFQVLLKLAADRAVLLSGIADMGADSIASTSNRGNLEEMAKRAMEALVKEIWFAYLESWQNAVDHFGRIFPEVRFSFRDSFLSVSQRAMVYRHISARVLQNVHDAKKLGKNDSGWTGAEGLEDDGDEKTRKRTKTDTLKDHTRKRPKLDLQSSNSDVESDVSESTIESFKGDFLEDGHYATINKSKNRKMSRRRYYREPLTSVNHMLSQLHHTKDQTIDKNEAALRLYPSMTLIASIVHLALLRLRTGIASFHLTSWAANGSYPYILNAFVHLPPNLQKKMEPVHKMFVNKTLPHPTEIDHTTDLLILACDLDMVRDRDNNFCKMQCGNFRHTKQMTELFSGRSGAKRHAKRDGMEERKDKRSTFKRSNDDSCPKNTVNKGSSVVKEDNFDESPMSVRTGNNGCNDDISLQRRVYKTPKTDPSVRNIYQDNIPMMACRLVTDLGLNQRVLDITLALMGLYRSDASKQRTQRTQRTQQSPQNGSRSEVDWLPGSLQGASPDRVVSPLHVMAVIVVACKMCPGWEGWQVQLATASDLIDVNTIARTQQDTNTSNKAWDKRKSPVKIDDEEGGKSEFDKDDDDEGKLITSSKRNENLKRQRFIPWEDDHLKFVGNGSMLENYLDFIEETYSTSLPILQQYQDDISSIQTLYRDLESHRDSRQSRKSRSSNCQTRCRVPSNCSIVVKPNVILAGAPNPNKPYTIKHKGTNLYQLLLCRHKGATWADANGFGEYIVYNNLKSHAATNIKFSFSMKRTPEPFHPHYGLLIEFAADTMGAEPGELHYLVSALDEEILTLYGRPELDWSLHHNAARCVKSRLRKSEQILKKRYPLYL